jgi:hypothetical protein
LTHYALPFDWCANIETIQLFLAFLTCEAARAEEKFEQTKPKKKSCKPSKTIGIIYSSFMSFIVTKCPPLFVGQFTVLSVASAY